MRPIFILHVIGMNVVGDIMYVTWSMSERSLMNKNQMNIRWEQDTRDFEEYWKWPTTWCIWSSPSNLKFYHRKYMLTKKWPSSWKIGKSIGCESSSLESYKFDKKDNKKHRYITWVIRFRLSQTIGLIN